VSEAKGLFFQEVRYPRTVSLGGQIHIQGHSTRFKPVNADHSKLGHPLIPPRLQVPVFVAAVYWWLLDALPLYESTVEALQERGLDLTDIARLNIRSCPTHTQNLIAAYECARRFGDKIYIAPGFFPVDRLPCACEECDYCQFRKLDECACAGKGWRIDLDSKLSARGLIVPETDSRGWIYKLCIHRHLDDRSAFALGVRG
jgi:hypothetical protein